MTKLREIETPVSDTTFHEDVEAVSDKVHRLTNDESIAPIKLKDRV